MNKETDMKTSFVSVISWAEADGERRTELAGIYFSSEPKKHVSDIVKDEY